MTTDSPRPNLSDELLSSGMFEEDVLLVAVCIDFVGVLGVFLVRHTDSRVDKGNIMLLVLV